MAMEYEQLASKFLASNKQWTSVRKGEDVIKHFKHVPRFEAHVVQPLELIEEGGQGKIYAAQVHIHNNHLNEDEQIPIDCVVKEFKIGAYGEWPEEVFELSKLFPNICRFLGYHIRKDEDGETFFLIMQRYDCSLRNAIDKQMMMKKKMMMKKIKLVFWMVFAIFYFLFVFYAPYISGHLSNYIYENFVSTSTHVVPIWYFVIIYVILQILFLIGGRVIIQVVIRLVFVSLFAYYKQKPFTDDRVLFMMIHIALGMQILHENPTWRPKDKYDVKKKILHRDLKADNVFVKCDKSGRFPIAAFIGDFDVGSKVVGTLFWRAPEILQAVKDGSTKELEFGPEADVYSYAMTCYEILTGGIPLEELKRSNYNVVLFGKRPKLPSDLNPKVKALIERCWDWDPTLRPTFCDIVLELEELVKELVIGSRDMSKIFEDMFDRAKNSLDIARVDAETNLVKLKELLQVLVVEYNQADFLLLGLEIVAAMEEFNFKFGFKSFKEQPGLPYSKWFARQKLFDIILSKRAIFARISAYIVELNKISALMENIIDVINEDNCPANSFCNDEKNATGAEIARRDEEWGGYLLEVQERMKNVPSFRHNKCVKSLVNSKSQDDNFQACNLCKFKVGASDEGNVKYRLYVDNDE